MKKLLLIIIISLSTLLASCVDDEVISQTSLLDEAYNELSLDSFLEPGQLPNEINGIKITWSANKQNVLVDNTLLPTLTDEDLTLTALLQYEDAKRTKTFNVTLQKSDEFISQTLLEAATFLSDELTIIFKEPISENIIFPLLEEPFVVTYFSEKPEYLDNNGYVTRPSIDIGNQTFVLYVSVTLQNKQETFPVTVTVKAIENSDSHIYTGMYEGANGLYGDELKSFLHNLIDNHTVLSYTALWDALSYTDEDPNNPDNVILIYSQVSIDEDLNGGDTNEWNREHVWPRSHGDLEDTPANTDLHHIRPSYVTVNSLRGNLDFDEGGSLVEKTTDAYKDADSFEPPDEVKGDIARMLFYMAVRYEGDVPNEVDLEINNLVNNDGPFIGRLSILLIWNEMDPPDEFEQRRNDRIEELQGNRNPFIDHPEFAEYIFSLNQD